MSFRDDGVAALEWAARYLERVGDFPVLAQVEPGEIRARLPASPPERGEPFADVLRDLDEILLRGMTHWQSPRFFSYFAVTSSEPAILAELLAATLNQVALVWRASPASTARSHTARASWYHASRSHGWAALLPQSSLDHQTSLRPRAAPANSSPLAGTAASTVIWIGFFHCYLIAATIANPLQVLQQSFLIEILLRSRPITT